MTARLPRQERLRSRSYSLGQSAGSVVISLRIKKPAAKHPFKPLVLRLRLKYAGKPVAAKIKASTKKAIPFSQKFDKVIISEVNTQRKYCFLICMDFFSGCFDEIFDLYNDVQDDFRVIFHSLQKDTFVEYLTDKEYDEYFG